MKIGSYTLENPVALAPMAGITDLPFRRLCKKLGAGYVVGEMLTSDPKLYQSQKSRLRGVHLNEPTPRAIQIVGWDPQALADAARYNVEQGASIIDINMGCPAKKVCRRHAGSALMQDESLVGRILDSVVRSVPVPVTLKIRTGVNPARRNGATIAKIAQSAGVSCLAVHGRTRECKFNGSAEYHTIKEICDSVSIPVFANGDIRGYKQAGEILRLTGAQGLMIGRAAHGAPWFPGQLAHFLETSEIPDDPSLDKQASIVLEHLEQLFSFYGSERGVRIARKHIKWYTQDHVDPGSFRMAFNLSDCPRQQLDLTAQYYYESINSYYKESAWQKREISQSTLAPKETDCLIA
ncbi:MAG: tRNA dihydrouridine synthase DusB [bacterium]